MENLELNPEILELISGGVIGESEEDVIVKMVRVFKKQDISLESAKDFFSQLPFETTCLKNTNADEVNAFLDSRWDSII